MKGYIYKATNTFNGMVYIGQTIHLDKRKAQHLREARIDEANRFHTALYQYPGAFEWEVIDTFSGDREYVTHTLNIAEEYHILKYNSSDPRYGYNANSGGYSSAVLNDRLKALAKKHEGTCKAMLQYDKEGHFLKEWESLSEISREFSNKRKGGKYKSINASEIIRGNHYGFQWRVKKDDNFPREIGRFEYASGGTYLTNVTPTIVYDIDGNYCGEYQMQKDAIQAYKDDGGTKVIYGEVRDIKLTATSKSKYFLFTKPENGAYPDKITITPYVKKEITKKGTSTSIPVLAYSAITGELIAEYPSRSEAHTKSGAALETIRYYSGLKEPYILRSPKQKFVFVSKSEPIKPRIEIIPFVKQEIKPKMEHRIIQYTLEGNFVKVWDNTHQAAKSGADSNALIRKSLDGKPTKKPTNFIWRYYTENYPQTIQPGKILQPKENELCRQDDTIEEISWDGTIIATYKNTADAAAKSGYSQSYICNVLAGKIKHPKRKFRRK